MRPAVTEAFCHSTPAAAPRAALAAESDCCGMSMGSSPTSGEPVEAVPSGPQFEPVPGEVAPGAPQLHIRLGEPPPKPLPPGLSTPLFTLHRSLLL